MREETILNAINDLDSINCMIQDIHESIYQDSPDYWTRLEHQYAGMAMQGILSNPQIWKDWNEEGLVTKDLEAADMADYFATALVEKLKSGSNEKTMH